MSTALPAYTFDNIGGSFDTFGSAASTAVAAPDNGRYIQDDLPMTTVLMPDGTSLPLSSFAVNGSGVVAPVLVDGAASVASYSQAQPTAASLLDSFISNPEDSLNFAANVSGTMTSDELSQYLQSGSVLTEMSSSEFHRQFDGIFQQTNDSSASHGLSSTQ